MTESFHFGLVVVLSTAGILVVLIIALLLRAKNREGSTPTHLASALTFIGAVLGFAFQFGLSVVNDNRSPDSDVKPFIEDILYGIPEIPMTYESGITNQRLIDDLQPLINSNEIITLSVEEANKLSTLARQSGQADGVVANRGYSAKEIALLVAEPMQYYHRYAIDYPSRLKLWSSIIDDFNGTDLQQFMQTFLNGQVRSQLDNSNVISTVVGQLDRGKIDIRSSLDEGLDERLPFIQRAYYNPEEEDMVIELKDWRLVYSAGKDDSERFTVARQVANLIQYAKIRTLSQLFEDAATNLESSAPALKAYVDEWNSIIKSREGENLILKVTFSNLTKYDSFVRTTGKIAVGAVGDDSLTTINARVIAIDDQDDNSPLLETFIKIGSRDAITQSFMCQLPKEKATRLFAAYSSGLNYLNAVFLASIGEDEKQIISHHTPFSKEAKKRTINRIDEVNLVID